MSYLPPPEPSGPPPKRSWTWPIVFGALITIGATVLGPVVSFALADTVGLFGLTFFAPLLCLVVGIVLVCMDSTRPWGLGLLIGFFVMLIVGAGACVLLIVAFTSAHGVAP